VTFEGVAHGDLLKLFPAVFPAEGWGFAGKCGKSEEPIYKICYLKSINKGKF
jgi:hypothetical protein